MQIDREALNRLMNLSDAQLRYVVNKLAAENGVDLSGFDIRPGDMASVRAALKGATDEDIRRIAEQVAASGRGKRGGR